VRRAAVVLVLALAAPLACARDRVTAPPATASLIVTLETPHTDDGAVVLALRGPLAGEPVAIDPGHEVFVLPDQDGGGARIAIVGDRLGGPLLALTAPREADLAVFQGVVVEVADLDDEVRKTVDGYRVNFSPPSR
jgi:hypothetical protein